MNYRKRGCRQPRDSPLIVSYLLKTSNLSIQITDVLLDRERQVLNLHGLVVEQRRLLGN